MKNLTVNMPLAVPHQKPPSKYASHPYPFVFADAYAPCLTLEEFTNRRVLREGFSVESLSSSIQIIDFTKQSIVKIISIEDTYNQASFELEGFSKITISQGLAEGNDHMTSYLNLESFTRIPVLITTHINKSNNMISTLNMLEFYKL